MTRAARPTVRKAISHRANGCDVFAAGHAFDVGMAVEVVGGIDKGKQGRLMGRYPMPLHGVPQWRVSLSGADDESIIRADYLKPVGER